MKYMLALSSIVFAWGNLSQACPCVDQETLTANELYHGASISVENAVVARLQYSALINMVKDSIVSDQAKIQELERISVNAGIPHKLTALGQGFTDRAKQEITQLEKLSGSALDVAYITFRAEELQRLLTAFDSYFVIRVTTPTMKAWTPLERKIVARAFDDATVLENILNPHK